MLQYLSQHIDTSVLMWVNNITQVKYVTLKEKMLAIIIKKRKDCLEMSDNS